MKTKFNEMTHYETGRIIGMWLLEGRAPSLLRKLTIPEGTPRATTRGILDVFSESGMLKGEHAIEEKAKVIR